MPNFSGVTFWLENSLRAVIQFLVTPGEEFLQLERNTLRFLNAEALQSLLFHGALFLDAL
jgi:hypothetical protein